MMLVCVRLGKRLGLAQPLFGYCRSGYHLFDLFESFSSEPPNFFFNPAPPISWLIAAFLRTRRPDFHSFFSPEPLHFSRERRSGWWASRPTGTGRTIFPSSSTAA